MVFYYLVGFEDQETFFMSEFIANYLEIYIIAIFLFISLLIYTKIKELGMRFFTELLKYKKWIFYFCINFMPFAILSLNLKFNFDTI